jgi:quercetin dioxygenase-like cupin family protein
MATTNHAALPAAEPLVLAAQVDYAAGSIVSRAIVQKKAGSLTLFAFDAGQALSEHTAPFDAWVQVLDGEAELVIGGKPIQVRVGQAALMPAGTPHAVNAKQRFKMLLSMIRE